MKFSRRISPSVGMSMPSSTCSRTTREVARSRISWRRCAVLPHRLGVARGRLRRVGTAVHLEPVPDRHLRGLGIGADRGREHPGSPPAASRPLASGSRFPGAGRQPRQAAGDGSTSYIRSIERRDEDIAFDLRLRHASGRLLDHDGVGRDQGPDAASPRSMRSARTGRHGRGAIAGYLDDGALSQDRLPRRGARRCSSQATRR